MGRSRPKRTGSQLREDEVVTLLKIFWLLVDVILTLMTLNGNWIG